MNATDFFKWTRRVSEEIPGAYVQVSTYKSWTRVSIRFMADEKLGSCDYTIDNEERLGDEYVQLVLSTLLDSARHEYAVGYQALGEDRKHEGAQLLKRHPISSKLPRKDHHGNT